MVTSKKETGGIPAPTISIAAWNPQTKNGWKGNTSMRYDLIGAYCKDEAGPVVDCIEENTFRQSEIFKDVVLGFTAQKSLWNQENLIKEDFTTDWDGIFYVIDKKNGLVPMTQSINSMFCWTLPLCTTFSCTTQPTSSSTKTLPVFQTLC